MVFFNQVDQLINVMSELLFPLVHAGKIGYLQQILTAFLFRYLLGNGSQKTPNWLERTLAIFSIQIYGNYYFVFILPGKDDDILIGQIWIHLINWYVGIIPVNFI